MAYKKLTDKTVYRWRSEFGMKDESAIIYHAASKEALFSCHASVIPLIKAANAVRPYAEFLRVLKPGAL